MRIAVAGGTGFIGGELCKELHRRGHEVTAISRNRMETDVLEGVGEAEGDVTRPDTLREPFRGSDAVVNLVALSPMTKPRRGEEMHLKVHLGGTENVVSVARDEGVDTVLQISAVGADPEGPTHYSRAKGRAEEAVKRSGLDYVVIRPSIVFGEGSGFTGFLEKYTPPYLAFLPGADTKFQPIWRGDLVPGLAGSLEDPDLRGRVLEVGGPEEFTLAEMTRYFHRSRGRPVKVVPLPGAVSLIALALLDRLPFVPLGMDQYRSLGMDNTVEDNAVRELGLEPGDMVRFKEFYGTNSGQGRVTS